MVPVERFVLHVAPVQQSAFVAQVLRQHVGFAHCAVHCTGS